MSCYTAPFRSEGGVKYWKPIYGGMAYPTETTISVKKGDVIAVGKVNAINVSGTANIKVLPIGSDMDSNVSLFCPNNYFYFYGISENSGTYNFPNAGAFYVLTDGTLSLTTSSYAYTFMQFRLDNIENGVNWYDTVTITSTAYSASTTITNDTSGTLLILSQSTSGTLTYYGSGTTAYSIKSCPIYLIHQMANSSYSSVLLNYGESAYVNTSCSIKSATIEY